MAIGTTATIHAAIDYRHTEESNFSLTVDRGKIDYRLVLESGKDAARPFEIDSHYTENVTISDFSHTLNLQNLSREIFGQSTTFSFQRINGLVIQNRTLSQLSVTTNFVDYSGSTKIAESGTYCISSMAGWNISGSGNDNLITLATTGDYVNFDFFVVGLSQ